MPAHDPYAPVGWVDETTGQVVPLEDEFDPETANVPDGTVDEVKAWVGDDVDRAELAILAEGERDHPRVTLLEHLNAMLERRDDAEADSSPADALLGVPGTSDAEDAESAPEGR